MHATTHTFFSSIIHKLHSVVDILNELIILIADTVLYPDSDESSYSPILADVV